MNHLEFEFSEVKIDDEIHTHSTAHPVTADKFPKQVLENIFSCLALDDLLSCSLVCKSWCNYLNDGNNDVWRLLYLNTLTHEAVESDILSVLPTYKDKLRAFHHSWSSSDCSRNIFVKPDGFTLHRRPEAQYTDGARGKIGFDSGRHSWDVLWRGPLGTVAMVGVATKEAPLRMSGYKPLLGSTDQSWAWNLVDNYLFHGGARRDLFPKCNNPPKYQVGEKITVVLDMEDNTLTFERDYEFLGVAFRGLPQTRLYPSVSAVYGNTEVTMVYKGNPTDG